MLKAPRGRFTVIHSELKFFISCHVFVASLF